MFSDASCCSAANLTLGQLKMIAPEKSDEEEEEVVAVVSGIGKVAAATTATTATSILGHSGEQVRVLLHDNFVLLALGLEFSTEHCHWIR